MITEQQFQSQLQPQSIPLNQDYLISRPSSLSYASPQIQLQFPVHPEQQQEIRLQKINKLLPTNLLDKQP